MFLRALLCIACAMQSARFFTQCAERRNANSMDSPRAMAPAASAVLSPRGMRSGLPDRTSPAKKQRRAPPKSFVHSCFEVTGDTAVCKYCQAKLSAKNVTRLKNHLLLDRTCPYLDDPAAKACGDKEVKQALQQRSLAAAAETARLRNDSSSTPGGGSTPAFGASGASGAAHDFRGRRAGAQVTSFADRIKPEVCSTTNLVPAAKTVA